STSASAARPSTSNWPARQASRTTLPAPSRGADAVTVTGGVLTGTGVRPAADAAVHLLLDGDEPPVTVPRDPAREAARRELSKGMYHENDPSWYQRALDAFWDWVGTLFDTASTATPGGVLGLLVIVAAVIAVLGAL